MCCMRARVVTKSQPSLSSSSSSSPSSPVRGAELESTVPGLLLPPLLLLLLLLLGLLGLLGLLLGLEVKKGVVVVVVVVVVRVGGGRLLLLLPWTCTLTPLDPKACPRFSKNPCSWLLPLLLLLLPPLLLKPAWPKMLPKSILRPKQFMYAWACVRANYVYGQGVSASLLLFSWRGGSKKALAPAK